MAVFPLENLKTFLKLSIVIISIDKCKSVRRWVLNVSVDQKQQNHRYPDGSNFLVLSLKISIVFEILPITLDGVKI